MIFQGTNRASRNGRYAEDAIADLLARRRIQFERQRKVGKSIYGKPVRADFYLPAADRCVEVKWQQIGGSADEKFAFLYLNAMRGTYPCPLIVVAAGGGARSCAVDWLRGQVDGDHLAAVYTFEEFMTWANRSL